MIYLQLFYEFFKAGLFAIGGGMATLPFLFDIADKTGWYTHAQLTNMIAISESTPGPIGVNTATYVGFTVGGIPGALVATAGLVAPSVIIILLVAMFLKAFQESRLVKGAFYGLRPASTGLIAAAGIPLLLTAVYAVPNINNLFTTAFSPDLLRPGAILLAVVVFVASNFIPKVKDIHPICFIAFSAIVGAVFRFGGV